MKNKTHIIQPQGKIKNWCVGSLFAFCFVVPLAAQQTHQETEYYERGMRAIRLGLYDEALADFQRVLQLNPQNAEAYCELGAVYRLKEKTDDALEAYLHALELPASSRTHGTAHLCLARLYRAQGRFADAENHGQHAVSMLPKNAEPFFRLADTYVQRGKLALAKRAYQQALALDENLAPVYQGLGKIAFLQDRLAEASQYYRKALTLAPYHAETHYNLGLVHRRLGQRSVGGVSNPDALQNLVEAKNLMTSFQRVKAYNEQTNRYRRRLLEQPTALEPRMKLAEAHIEIGNPKEAIRVYQIATALHPEVLPLYHNLGGLYMQTGQFPEAISAFQRLIQRDDTDAEAHLHLGWLHARQRKFTAAQTYLQVAIQRNKNLTPAYYGLAEVYAQQHMFADAIAVYQQLISIHPNDAKAWVRRGVLHLKQQQISDAIFAFTQAIVVDENSADAHNNLAWLYATQGEHLKRAVELAERAVALDMNAARLDTLAYAYYRYGAYTEAEQTILRAIDLEPNNTAYKDRLNEIRQAMDAPQKRF
ncbi:tetratricopeptide repeat protein [Candidatus Poribacteria bacterium]|nr:tetratricopeptide repeat protein [Candidatus Poribacteria bacterium]